MKKIFEKRRNQQSALSIQPGRHPLGISQAKWFRILIESTSGTPPGFGKWVILKSSNWQLAISQTLPLEKQQLANGKQFAICNWPRAKAKTLMAWDIPS
jgi:hypothetical protein